MPKIAILRERVFYITIGAALFIGGAWCVWFAATSPVVQVFDPGKGVFFPVDTVPVMLTSAFVYWGLLVANVAWAAFGFGKGAR